MSYEPIRVEVITNNGLTKNCYDFTCEHTTLRYTSYSCYNRDTTDDLWANEWPEPLNFKNWCEKSNINPNTLYDEYDEDGWDYSTESYYYPYKDYLNQINSAKTKDGRVCNSGASGHRLAHYHPLPDGVKEKALQKFFSMVTVEEE